ncbi:outer membrane beta-barrel family protein [Flavobacterium sp.]|uniref:outer membrane beta-barrel family protein n=1 Tax=Flavobacterium sp. TaxID=239 RepID=UPI0037AEE198
MKTLKLALVLIAFFISFINYAQVRPQLAKIKITGKVVEKISQQPLEYATITFVNPKFPKAKTGGITNTKGEYDIDLIPGIYDIKIEFISFKPTIIKQRKLLQSTNLGLTNLEEDASQLNEVIVRSEVSTVEIKLDKKVYNVGKDMIVKGGTASDVLDNVPSVTVDGDGNVSLRGNDNVKILIDGRPSNAINVADALRTISADALDKVEVITNPSARYDAEGGGGIINIILKKEKTQGTNGTFVATLGNPQNYGISSTLNFKNENFNLFSTIGYNDSKSPGNSITNTDYLNPDGSIQKTIDEKNNNTRSRKGYNFNFGTDWYLDKTLTWTNAISYRKNDGANPNNDNIYNYEPNNDFISNRFNDQYTKTMDVEYNTNFTKKFKKDGHKLTVSATFASDTDVDTSIITNSVYGSQNIVTQQATNNNQSQSRNLFQADYVLPLGKNSQFEAGYKGDFNQLLTNYGVGDIDINGNYTPNLNYTNTLDYREKINALYTQFGSKINKFSYLLGLRYEDSNIDINLLTTNDYTNKRYHNFFPSAFLTYQITDDSNFSLNYSRRIARPRSRFINPFSNYSSNINIMQGNPNLNPSFTDSFDMGYMTKLGKVNLSSSIYFNKTADVFQFIRRPNGEIVTSIVNGVTIQTPVMLSTPINLSNENRFGFEFNANYSPFKWWKLNGNFNFFESKISGNYTYTPINSTIPVFENFDNTAFSWFAKLSSKVTLPFKIDWQTNGQYNAPQNNAQGRSLGVFVANMAFSKDVLKDKATITLNASDLLNSRKRITETNLPTINSYSEMQWRMRQINLTFTYRFNKKKAEKEKPQKRESDNGDDFQG